MYQVIFREVNPRTMNKKDEVVFETKDAIAAAEFEHKFRKAYCNGITSDVFTVNN